ncbi:citronellol/citronellal dehydrogenase [Arthrobacter silviterrae]|uniref:Peroxisomal trans-2-enoyl-CoA reductase n=1 Tax=Arthrobacter silviterrae TaxID=2026658 RepID=A0ABX0D9E5_9MICC|nr:MULTISPECIES: SDR family oxidoreductase [Arthrobacter]MCU6478965.1 SDR family oxidoreductase [Arthrobacter sp. A2-55]MDQ0277955.1 citronellol/citronellal dehydrogenase [Arthrobacter silviterrae]NGN83509.1 SDR family oxidoreductase [Arthrobacter silviterrae]
MSGGFDGGAPAPSLHPEALAGKVALVTGGGTGIGRATALSMARSGARLVLAGRRAELLQETAELVRAAGSEAITVAGDIRDADHVVELVDRAVSEFGRVDVLVNNAGGQFQAPAEDISLNGWRAVHRLSVEAVWNLTREVAVRSMIPNRSGLLVFMAFSPHRGIPGMVHATAARAAVENLASGLALEWSRYGIRSVAVAPGSIESEGLDQYTEEARRGWEQGVPLGRLGRPEDVSGVIAFLATDAARYITGTTIDIDGGANAWGSGRPVPTKEP